MSTFQTIENEHGAGCYPMRDMVLVEGQSAIVKDEKGISYVDCVAGHGVANVGHCNPKVVASIKKQADRLITCSGSFYNDARSQLLQKLIEVSPGNLTNSTLR